MINKTRIFFLQLDVLTVDKFFVSVDERIVDYHEQVYHAVVDLVFEVESLEVAFRDPGKYDGKYNKLQHSNARFVYHIYPRSFIIDLSSYINVLSMLYQCFINVISMFYHTYS